METNYLFVYGTLMSNHQNSYACKLREGAEFVGNGYTNGFLNLLGEYPGAVYSKSSKNKIHGEIYNIKLNSKELLAFLDRYEDIDANGIFERIIVPAISSKNKYNCWFYNYKGQLPNLKYGKYL